MRIDGPQITGSFSLNGDGVQDLDVFATTSSLNLATSSLATTGSNIFVGTQTISGSIIPAVNNTYDLGSTTHQFRDLYLSSASLYIDGTKVLSSTTQELQITTDAGQSFKILEAGSDTITLQSGDGNITLASSGGGDVILDPTNGVVALKGTVTVYSGNKVISSDGNAIHIGDDIVISGSILSTGTPLVSGSEQIVYSELSGLPSNIISGSEQLSTLGIATTGSNTFNGNLTVNGYIDTQELRTTFISSSILYRSGSTKFGDESTDTHTFTGSLNILGSLGNNPVTLQGDASSNAWLRLKSGLTNSTFQIGVATGSFFVYDEVNNKIKFTINGDGDFGFGTDDPTVFGSGMEIKTGTQTGLRLSSTAVNGSAIEIGADNNGGYIQNVVVGDKINFYTSNTTATDTNPLTILPNGKIGIGDTDPDNTYQGLTIKGGDPSLRLKTTSSSGWTWIEYVNNSGTNTWSMGVNHTSSYFGIKSGAGLDSPNFKMSTGGLIEISRSSPMTTESEFDYKNIIIKTGFGSGYTGAKIQPLISGYDGSIYGVDIGYSYDGGGVGNVGYSLRFSTNDDLTGNPIERLRINSIGTSTFSGNVISSGYFSSDAYRDSRLQFLLGYQGSNEIRMGSGTATDFLTFYAGAVERIRVGIDGAMAYNTSITGVRSYLFKALPGRQLAIEALESGGVHSIYLRPSSSGRNLITSNYFGGGVYLPLALSGRENDADFVLHSNGNISMGSATDGGVRLSITGANSAEGQLYVGNTNVEYSAGINFTTTGTNRGFVGWRHTFSGAPFSLTGIHLFNTDNSNIVFGTNNLVRAVINTNGNLGINDNNPATRLSVNGANYVEMATFAITNSSSSEIVANNTGALNFTTRHNSNSSVFSITTGGIQILKAGIVHVSFSQDIRTAGTTGYVAMYIRKNGSPISENLITNTNTEWDMITGVATTSVSANDIISFFITPGVDVLAIDPNTWSQYSFIWASR